MLNKKILQISTAALICGAIFSNVASASGTKSNAKTDLEAFKTCMSASGGDCLDQNFRRASVENAKACAAQVANCIQHLEDAIQSVKNTKPSS